MAFAKGSSGNPAGRPRGRIAKFRAALGDATRDGQEMVDELTAIWRDRETPVRERLAAIELGLAYLLGKPEASVSIDADITARPGALDMGAILARLPSELVERVVAELDADPPPLLLAAPEGDG